MPTNCLSVFGHFVGLALKELILSKFRQINKVNVFIEQSFLMISRGIKFDQFVKIRLILQAKFGDDP